MKLTDAEILELSALCDAVVDDTLTDAQRARLTAWLAASEPAREFYVRVMALSASLHTYAGEMQTDAAEAPRRFSSATLLPWFVPLAAAAALAFGFWIYRPATVSTLPLKPEDFVARITGAKDSRWAGGTVGLQPGDHIQKGQRLELTAGLAEITFDSGARVVLKAPASLDVNSAWDGLLRRGTLTASVPPEAIGFRISNSSVEVVDLGTEFTMIADAGGNTEVLVLKGEVEAAPRTDGDDETILLRQNESRRFARSGVSAVSDSQRKIAQFLQPVSLDRFSQRINYVHWSFDEMNGESVKAKVSGAATDAAASVLKIAAATDLNAARTPSPHGRALRFDGRLQASGRVPGISGNSPRTVAFWVKVPKDAVADAWMVSWGTSVKKLGSRPVQISWNRRPGDGSFGALRTDFGGGYAIGAQDLRDGHWHHVVVCFAPGETAEAPVQVKQYIDGRLESSTITLTPGTPRTSAANASANLAAANDVVWLGCRLTGKQPERFRGELDELFIADRGLEPQEIVSLMNNNRLPDSEFAAAR